MEEQAVGMQALDGHLLGAVFEKLRGYKVRAVWSSTGPRIVTKRAASHGGPGVWRREARPTAGTPAPSRWSAGSGGTPSGRASSQKRQCRSARPCSLARQELCPAAQRSAPPGATPARLSESPSTWRPTGAAPWMARRPRQRWRASSEGARSSCRSCAWWRRRGPCRSGGCSALARFVAPARQAASSCRTGTHKRALLNQTPAVFAAQRLPALPPGAAEPRLPCALWPGAGRLAAHPLRLPLASAALPAGRPAPSAHPPHLIASGGLLGLLACWAGRHSRCGAQPSPPLPTASRYITWTLAHPACRRNPPFAGV